MYRLFATIVLALAIAYANAVGPILTPAVAGAAVVAGPSGIVRSNGALIGAHGLAIGAPGLIGGAIAPGLIAPGVISSPGLAAKVLGLEGSGIEGQWIPDINEKLYDDGSYKPWIHH